MSALPPKADLTEIRLHVRYVPKADMCVECAPGAGQVEARELTGCAGLSKDESHGQTAFPQH